MKLPSMNRRALGGLVALGLGAVVAASWWGGLTDSVERTEGERRLVSLSPAVTETLRVFGRLDEVVAISDFDDSILQKPRVGSALTPHYERIVLARPTLILATAAEGTKLGELERLAETKALPWLSASEVASSVEELGRLVGAEEPARLLAARFRALPDEPPKDAPRVLLILNADGGELRQVWYIRKDSVHGSLLHAAGGRHAIEESPRGAPRISIEELLRVAPDLMIVLGAEEQAEAAIRVADELRKLEPLLEGDAARVQVLLTKNPFGVGPELLELEVPLAALVRGQRGTRLRGHPD